MFVSLKMDSSPSCDNQQNKNGIMDDENHCLDTISDRSDVSSDSDLFEEVNSSASSSPPSSPTSGSSSEGQLASGPLQDMSSLLQELPFKRGLSKHYDGKSQSFTSLSNVRCLEDLAKPDNPYNKKLKSCRSYGGFFESNGSSNQPSRSSSSSRLIAKKASRGSCSSLCVKKNPSFLGTRPPVPPPHRSSSSSSFTTQTRLFALGV